MVAVRENLIEIQAGIAQAAEKAGRNKEDINIIAVTKYVTIERAKETISAGIVNLGENRNEGFLAKFEEIQDSATWHFIGSLQSRKVKDIIHHVDYIHSLDRKSLAKEINKRSQKTVPCFVQVNVSGEESKHGLAEEDVESFVKELAVFENIRVVGLMTMAPHVDNPEDTRPLFKKLRLLRDYIQKLDLDYAPCEYLSMGMSNDYKVAIEEGATHIRVGTKLVGKEI
ncbi:YggS family pyridoxal phosphate-dependent enzyme [Oceanobacillus jeddahense]|uniref:Pyridoxal phosphate homeostasis protein n=1 Tax=Oceanobacillus jeddahense TaxID=1462527 RepID=A0ABY5JQ69_9BACI|nr:YggS family pyridoxal phosphate-dependent enzyme [Oceanobacillus jeddahense]UUI01617.1 YggS family pyridoxal phosphate-dependent enzyme [Oceanobacillus jeddahense]